MSFTRQATEFKPGAKKQIYSGQHNGQNLDQLRGKKKMTITTFRKLYVMDWYDWDDNKVNGFIYLPENRDIPTAPDFIDNWLHIRENSNSDKKYYMLLDRGEYERDKLEDLENILFNWAEGEYHQGSYKIIDIENQK